MKYIQLSKSLKTYIVLGVLSSCFSFSTSMANDATLKVFYANNTTGKVSTTNSFYDTNDNIVTASNAFFEGFEANENSQNMLSDSKPELIEAGVSLNVSRRYRRAPRIIVTPPPVFSPGWFSYYFWPTPPPPQYYQEQPSNDSYYQDDPNTQYAPEPTVPPRNRDSRRTDRRDDRRDDRDKRHANVFKPYTMLGLGIGLNSGNYQSSDYYSGDYEDAGFNVRLQYRRAPSLGFELSSNIFSTQLGGSNDFNNKRIDRPIQASLVAVLFPNGILHAYVLAGLTANIRTYSTVASYDYESESYYDSVSKQTELRVGPHVGIGLELPIGRSFGLFTDIRAVAYPIVPTNEPEITSRANAMWMVGGNFYF